MAVSPVAPQRRAAWRGDRGPAQRSPRLASWVTSGTRRLRLLQPEPHVHLAIHSSRSRQVLGRLRSVAGAPVELAQAEMAVGDEGAHVKLVGERERVTIVAFCLLREIAAGGDVAE